MKQFVSPKWISKIFSSKTGRDHLGLGSVSSDQILPTLSPSVNVLTIHPRYYSFYTFLLDEFWRRERQRSQNSWVNFYRPREFIFSLGAHLCDQPEHNDMKDIVGSRKTAPLSTNKRDSYNTQFNYIKSKMGGYGLYYRPVMAELGLVYPGGMGFSYPIDVPTEYLGKELASNFRRAVKSTTYYRDYFDNDVTDVPINTILEYIRKACLCQLQLPNAPDRLLLIDILLHRGPKAEARRSTFRLLLDIALQTQGIIIDQNAFRQLLYFKETYNKVNYSPRNVVKEIYKRWRLYQAREYYAFALNALWYYLCDWGLAQGGDLHPIQISRFWQHIDIALDFNSLSARLGLSNPGLKADDKINSLLHWLKELHNTDEDSFDIDCKLNSPINEYHLYEIAMEYRNAPDVMIAGMVTMLALIFLRFGKPDIWRRSEWDISRMGSEGRLSVDDFVRSVRHKIKSDHVTISEITRWLFEYYIIFQHQIVATSKLPEDTFRFRREGDQLRFFNFQNQLGFMDSRFNALSTTIHELGFCSKFNQLNHHLTHDGQNLLKEGDLK